MSRRRCQECKKLKHDVVQSSVTWTAWGRNAFDFNWSKTKEGILLCDECENANWIYCSGCGALVSADDYGRCYLPRGYDGESICPDCAQEKGFEVMCGIGEPPWNKSGAEK